MTISYLVVAHHNFDHLKLLIEGLTGTSCHFFVHIDKRADFKESEWPKNVHFIPRQKVHWGDFSQVAVSLKLLETASKTHSDYYCLLSGVDYPIKPNTAFYQKLSSERKEYINILKGPQASKPMYRFDRYYLPNTNKRAQGLKAMLVKAVEKLIYFSGIRPKLPAPLFVGSNWFILSNQCVHYMLEYVRNNPSYVRYFKHTLCPDEAFFHTIIGNSHFYENCVHNLTYADWEVPHPPAEISEKHLTLFKEKSKFTDMYGAYEAFFARKFGADSHHIVKEIEQTLRR